MSERDLFGPGRLPVELNAYIDGRMAPREAAATREAIADDANAREWVDICREQNAALRALYEVRSPDERGAEIAAAALRLEGAVERAAWTRRIAYGSVAAVAFLVALRVGGPEWPLWPTGGGVVRPIALETPDAAPGVDGGDLEGVAAAPAPAPDVNAGAGPGPVVAVIEPAAPPPIDPLEAAARAASTVAVAPPSRLAEAPRDPNPYLVADVVWPQPGASGDEPVHVYADIERWSEADPETAPPLPFVAPDFRALGFELVERRALPPDFGGATQFHYRDPNARRVVLLVAENDSGGDHETWVRIRSGQSAMHWRVGPYFFGLAGQLSPADVALAARLVHDGLARAGGVAGDLEDDRQRMGLQTIEQGARRQP